MKIYEIKSFDFAALESLSVDRIFNIKPNNMTIGKSYENNERKKTFTIWPKTSM